MKLILLDLDYTLVPYSPRGLLYERVLLDTHNIKYVFFGLYLFMLDKFFWMFPTIIKHERRLLTRLLYQVTPKRLEEESELISTEVAAHYNEHFKKRIANLVDGVNKVYILTHCPEIIALKLTKKLNFDGCFAIPITSNANIPEIIFDKSKALKKLKQKHNNAETIFISDNLLDAKCLNAADHGILVNGSWFTRVMFQIFYRNIEIWK